MYVFVFVVCGPPNKKVICGLAFLEELREEDPGKMSSLKSKQKTAKLEYGSIEK